MAIVEEMLGVFEITTGRVLLECKSVVLLLDRSVLSTESDSMESDQEVFSVDGTGSVEAVAADRCLPTGGGERQTGPGSGRTVCWGLTAYMGVESGNDWYQRQL